MKRKPSSSDVAAAAGVSKWTVIRAFDPQASIAESSRERVLKEAAKLGYRPNLLARSLATNTTNLVAVLVDDFVNFHKLPVLELVTLALQAEGKAAILININQRFDVLEALLNAGQRQVDAVILLGTAFRDETLQNRADLGSSPPLFVLARESTIGSILSVHCDAEKSMMAIGTHLWEQGYRRPGYMSGPRTLSTALGRGRYFSEFWQGRNVAVVPDLAAGSYDPRDAASALRKYLKMTPESERIDVLMCENDALAIGAIDVARFEFGLKIPKDLAIVGYDGTAISAAPAYDITTYEQPLEQMVKSLISMMKGRLEPESIAVEGRLIVRSSTQTEKRRRPKKDDGPGCG